MNDNTKNYDLDDKVIIVTGAGSGLGKAMALGLAAQGARVTALDVDFDAAKATSAEAAGGRVFPLAVDVTEEADCADAVQTTMAEHNGLHVLVNCAGLGMASLKRDYMTNRLNFWEADVDHWQRLINVNVRGTFLMARAATPHLIAQGWGRIVNVTTSFNTMMRGGNMPYGQSKAALEAASAAWADDLKDTGVSCNVLIPGGAADTPMVPEESPYDRSKLNKPEVMVAPICWLASNLSEGVNGRRFKGCDWDPAIAPGAAAKTAGSPIAWPDLAQSASSNQPKAQT
jgi:3-oxoacyl-[acyl-carrier protein] reductase